MQRVGRLDAAMAQARRPFCLKVVRTCWALRISALRAWQYTLGRSCDSASRTSRSRIKNNFRAKPVAFSFSVFSWSFPFGFGKPRSFVCSLRQRNRTGTRGSIPRPFLRASPLSLDSGRVNTDSMYTSFANLWKRSHPPLILTPNSACLATYFALIWTFHRLGGLGSSPYTTVPSPPRIDLLLCYPQQTIR